MSIGTYSNFSCKYLQVQANIHEPLPVERFISGQLLKVVVLSVIYRDSYADDWWNFWTTIQMPHHRCRRGICGLNSSSKAAHWLMGVGGCVGGSSAFHGGCMQFSIGSVGLQNPVWINSKFRCIFLVFLLF